MAATVATGGQPFKVATELGDSMSVDWSASLDGESILFGFTGVTVGAAGFESVAPFDLVQAEDEDATRTPALGLVEAEQHRTGVLWVYSSFEGLLQKRKMKCHTERGRDRSRVMLNTVGEV